MTNVNIEGLVEVECKFLNEEAMKKKGLTKSPELKVQLFLNKFSADYRFVSTPQDSCTKIICERRHENDGSCRVYDFPCQYNNLSIK